jgi:hypothetical protein
MTTVAWSVSPDGDAHLEQARGAAFYRVEKGGTFVVKVPTGEVRVRGTCFSVEVVAMGGMGTTGTGGTGGTTGATGAGKAVKPAVAGLGGMAVGAAATAFVLVTVYEGRVEAQHGDDVRAVLPGERAVLRGDAPVEVEAASAPRPEIRVPSASEGRVHARDPAAAAAQPTNATAGGGTSEPACGADLAAARRESDGLKARLATLEARAQEADELRDAHKSYDLSQAALDGMAQKCELRWDTIPYRLGDPPTVPSDDAERFGLTPAQVATLNELLAAENARLVAAIRDAYVELTGDDANAIAAVAPTALFDEIEDKTPRDELKRVFQTLAAERAQHAAPVTDPSALARLSPSERVMRIVTSAGDRFEATLAERFGAEAAHKMRDLHHGFGSVSRSSHGCPEGEP